MGHTKIASVAAAIATSVCLAWLSPANAAPAASMDGVWRIESPSTLLTPADGQPIPFTEEGRQRYEANRSAAAKNDFSFDPTTTSCSSPGQPRLALTAMPFAVLVRPRMVTILYQWNRLSRQINVGKPFTNPTIGDAWWQFGTVQGRSIAKWQGKTLVVRTTNFIDGKLLDALLPSSDKLEVTERIRLVNADVLEDQIKITDPVNFARPWTATVRYVRAPETKLPFKEDVCFDRLHAGLPPIGR